VKAATRTGLEHHHPNDNVTAHSADTYPLVLGMESSRTPSLYFSPQSMSLQPDSQIKVIIVSETRYKNREDILTVVQNKVAQISMLRNADGISCLPHHWQHVTDNLGNYFERCHFHIHTVC
jgi:hypothetical protein